MIYIDMKLNNGFTVRAHFVQDFPFGQKIALIDGEGCERCEYINDLNGDPRTEAQEAILVFYRYFKERLLGGVSNEEESSLVDFLIEQFNRCKTEWKETFDLEIK